MWNEKPRPPTQETHCWCPVAIPDLRKRLLRNPERSRKTVLSFSISNKAVWDHYDWSNIHKHDPCKLFLAAEIHAISHRLKLMFPVPGMLHNLNQQKVAPFHAVSCWTSRPGSLPVPSISLKGIRSFCPTAVRASRSKQYLVVEADGIWKHLCDGSIVSSFLQILIHTRTAK